MWVRIVAIGVVLLGVIGIAAFIYTQKNLPPQASQCSDPSCQVSQKESSEQQDNKTGEDKKEAEKEQTDKTRPNETKPSQPKPNQPGGSTGGGSSSGGGGSTGGTTTPPPSGGSGTQSCPAFPAFPDENCTGVPAGVSLSSVGSFSSSSNGQTISGLQIAGDLVVNHSNVTVTNTRITGRVVNNSGSNLVMKDVDIGPDSCPGSSNGGNRLIGNAGYTLIRAHLHNNAADLIHMGGGGNILIQDSLLNKTCYYSGDHLDVAQFYDPGGVVTATLQHNTMDARPINSGGFGNAAVFWADFPGAGSRLNVYDNFMAGGNYTIYGLDAPSGSGVVIDVSGNRFLRNAYNYGPCVLSNSDPFDGSSGVIWTNNAFSDGGAINIGDC